LYKLLASAPVDPLESESRRIRRHHLAAFEAAPLRRLTL
jgi:hypothetical protein